MMRRTIAIGLAVALMAAVLPAGAEEPVKVVYHLSEDEAGTLAVRNINNHLAADPSAKIVVVALFRGVRAFVFGAQDATGRPYADWVNQLSAKGVEFRVCKNSMDAFKITAKDLTETVQVVPSGVAEIARLQAREGYGYIRP
jgi:intracellular sulfur oxidation DsrE/DsrF family protein